MKNVILTSAGIIFFGIASFFITKNVSDSFYSSPNLANGKKAYIAYCLECHGQKGLGNGVVSVSMTVKPDSIYQELSNPFGFKAELINSVLSGDNGQGGVMPAFNGTLTETDVNDIFGYIVTINQSVE